jgi:hypothetical protein
MDRIMVESPTTQKAGYSVCPRHSRDPQMVYSIPMMSLEDTRWSEMTGGYRTPLDPRPLLRRLQTDSDTTEVWRKLWDELHHQGDVGEASFASVPFLVKSYQERGALDRNTYAIVAIIELARNEGTNPDVPQWLGTDYFDAIRQLAEIGTTEVMKAGSPEDVRSILSIIAIEKGLRTHGRFLVDYSEDELIDLESKS